MPHPLRTARPTDPFLHLNLDEAEVLDYRVERGHVAFIRPGRRGGELWVSALGDDPALVAALIDDISIGRDIDGIHVHAEVYPLLPDRFTIADPGHWSIWTITPEEADHRLARWSAMAVDLDAHDRRIDDVLSHSDSAYLFAGNESVRRWVGVTDGDRLLAVGGESEIAGGTPHLVSICTAPPERGRGLGRSVTASLVLGVFARGESLVCLEMYAGNAPAAALYRSLGFREVGVYRSGWLPGRAPTTPRDAA